MTYCCSQCSFTAQFESALQMHRQLHHGKTEDNILKEKSKTVPRSFSPESVCSRGKFSKGLKSLNRQSSATRLFDKLRSRICRSRTMLFSHPEESGSFKSNDIAAHDTSLDLSSDCTSKALNAAPSRISALSTFKDNTETYSCHLCNFDANRITVLDRHLLNDHKITLQYLLQLVVVKTREGLNETPGPDKTGIRQPYYRTTNLIMDEEEFILETTAPIIKIMKNAATNTEISWQDIPNLKDDCRMITKELETLMSNPETRDKEDFMEKMKTLNEYMCKFVNTSNSLKKTLNREFSSKNSVRDRKSFDQALFNLNLGEITSHATHLRTSPDETKPYSKSFFSQNTPREWERPHSEKIDRTRTKYGDCSRGDKKLEAESFYF